MGPLRAMRFLRMELMTSSGTGVPYLVATSAPASIGSQAIGAPVASTTSTAARITSGPIPSPGSSVTVVAISSPQRLPRHGKPDRVAPGFHRDALLFLPVKLGTMEHDGRETIRIWSKLS